ncbi:hypothetical protein Tco_0090829 [Tanacetum coccineum]
MSKEVGTPRYLSLVVPLKKVVDEAVHKELGNRMESIATTASSLEAEQDSGSGPRCQDTILGDVDAQTRANLVLPVQINDAEGDSINTSIQVSTLTFADTHNMVAFLEKPAKSDGFHEIIDFLNANQIRYALTVNPTIYTSCIEQFWAPAKAKTVNGERGTDCLPTAIIFEELARMGMKRKGKDFSGRITPLFETMMVQPNQEVGVDSDIPTDSHQTSITTQPSSSRSQKKQSRRKQRKDTAVTQEETQQDDSVPTPFNDPLLSAKEIANLKKRVQKLERKKKSRTTGLQRLRKVGMSRRVESSKDKDSLGDPEDASKQGRSIEDIDKDADISLVDDTQGRSNDVEMFDIDDLHGDEVVVNMPIGEKQEQSTKEREVNTAVKDSVATTIQVSTTDEGVTAAKIDGITYISAPTTVIDELTLA